MLKTALICALALIGAEAFAPRSMLKLPKRQSMRQMSMAYDYDVIIVGCGVGGHGAALHAHSQGLKTCVLAGGDVGGTCVNRGCVPSKVHTCSGDIGRKETHRGAAASQPTSQAASQA